MHVPSTVFADCREHLVEFHMMAIICRAIILH